MDHDEFRLLSAFRRVLSAEEKRFIVAYAEASAAESDRSRPTLTLVTGGNCKFRDVNLLSHLRASQN